MSGENPKRFFPSEDPVGNARRLAVEPSERDRLRDAILGCLVGGAIGDAAGATLDGVGPSNAADWRRMAWRLTDDTQLTLATCEAIVHSGGPDPAAIADRFREWYRLRRLTGLGASTLKALRDLDAGVHWARAGSRGERAAGNGAAMRIAPLALCLDVRRDDARAMIREVCRITHHHDEAYAGALAVALAVSSARSGAIDLHAILSRLPDSLVRDRLDVYSREPADARLPDLAVRHGASGFVAESVPLAIFAAARFSELGLEAMLDQILRAGGDSDSNASIACQIAGAKLGYRRLPKPLVDRLPDADLVHGIAEDFARFLCP